MPGPRGHVVWTPVRPLQPRPVPSARPHQPHPAPPLVRSSSATETRGPLTCARSTDPPATGRTGSNHPRGPPACRAHAGRLCSTSPWHAHVHGSSAGPPESSCRQPTPVPQLSGSPGAYALRSRMHPQVGLLPPPPPPPQSSDVEPAHPSGSNRRTSASRETDPPLPKGATTKMVFLSEGWDCQTFSL